MALNFPNESRSYDATKRRIRFWAHDESLEICFFVEEAALRLSQDNVSPSEAAILDAFDRRRGQIRKAAGRIYARHSRNAYTLTAADID